MAYWTYRAFPRRRGRVHVGSCVWCNDGQGTHGTTTSEVGEWTEFASYAAAIGDLTDLGWEDVKPCGTCQPELTVR